MYNNEVKVPCERCDHAKVCMFKDQFMAAQKEVNTCSILIGENSMKYLKDFEWIKPVELVCIHFTEHTPAFAKREAP